MIPNEDNLKNTFYFTVSVLFALIVIASDQTRCFADEEERITTQKVFEYSLTGLKESAQSLAQRNEYLRNAIESMMQDDQKLEGDLNGVQVKKAEKLSRPVKRSDSFQKKQSGQNVVDQSLTLMQEQREALNKSQIAKQEREEDLKAQIAQLRSEIDQIKSNVNDLSSEKFVAIISKKDSLRQAIQETSQKNNETQKHLEQLQRTYSKPLKELAELKDRQSMLNDQVAVLDNDLKVILAQQADLKQEMESISGANKEKLSILTDAINELSLKKKEYESVLIQAKQKISEKNIDLLRMASEAEEMKRNKEVVIGENVALKQEFLQLEQQLDQ